jgi:hypothetical protein
MANPPANYDPLVEELGFNTALAVVFEWPRFYVLTDRDLSMLGEARHRTVGGRGAVGRLIDQAEQRKAGNG